MVSEIVSPVSIDDARSLYKTARNTVNKFHKIGSTGKIGEEALKALGGKSQKVFETSLGKRVVDQFVGGVAHESKVGAQSLTKTIKLQIQKDVELMKNKDVEGVTWHFFTSPVTGKCGPSKPLLNELQKNGIQVILHE